MSNCRTESLQYVLLADALTDGQWNTNHHAV
jgi:hypothetical protein